MTSRVERHRRRADHRGRSRAGLREDDRDRQHEVYEKTFRALEDITPDDDEGVTVVAEWIVEQIRTNGERPSPRAVRRRTGQYCRENGFEVGNDDRPGARSIVPASRERLERLLDGGVPSVVRSYVR